MRDPGTSCVMCIVMYVNLSQICGCKEHNNPFGNAVQMAVMAGALIFGGRFAD